MINSSFLEEKIFPYSRPDQSQETDIEKIYYKAAKHYALTEPKNFLANADFHFFKEPQIVCLAKMALHKHFDIKPLNGDSQEIPKSIYSPLYFDQLAEVCPEVKIREALSRDFIKSLGLNAFKTVEKKFKLNPDFLQSTLS